MSSQLLQPDFVLPGLPAPTDVADLWLSHGLASLLDACGTTDEATRLDASRLTVVFAALAVEARLNRVVRERDLVRWGADAQLTPLEKFQLLPRLKHATPARHNEVAEHVVEVFDLRDELVDTGPPTAPLDPRAACRALTAAGETCVFLDDPSGTAAMVRDLARSLAKRAKAASDCACPDSADFPPDLIGA